MKKFEGTWQIQPFTQEALDQNFGFSGRKGQHWSAGPLNAFQGFQRSKPLMEMPAPKASEILIVAFQAEGSRQVESKELGILPLQV